MRPPAEPLGIRDAGGNLTAGGADGVSMVLIAVHLPTSMWYCDVPRPIQYGTVWYQALARAETDCFRHKEATWRRPSLTMRLRSSPPTSTRFDAACSTASPPRSPSADTAPAPSPTSSGTPARQSARSTTTVRRARSSAFSSCWRCRRRNLAREIRGAVDPDATGRLRFVRPSRAYVSHIEARPAITLSWIRQLPSLDAAARPVQRRGMQLLTGLLINLSGSPGFQQVRLPPLTGRRP